jgi:hypothetical protein
VGAGSFTSCKGRAVAILTALVALIVLGLSLPTGPARIDPAGSAPARDLDLYQSVVAQVRAGQPYETAAIAAQRAGNYPLRPFVVVRPPALALGLARLPSEGAARALLTVLAAAVVVAWLRRLIPPSAHPAPSAGCALILMSGVAAGMFGRHAYLLHETWAGLLIALSLAMRTNRRFVMAAALGLLAGLIRELAIPYVLLMSLIALGQQRFKEAAAFGLAAALALAALASHAAAVNALVTPADLASPGWLTLGGWSFVLATAGWNAIPLQLGAWAAAVLAPLALVGAFAWRDPGGLRLAAVLLGYTMGFFVIGRPENNYWGLLVAPLMAVGLSRAPLAVCDLIRRTLAVEPVVS